MKRLPPGKPPSQRDRRSARPEPSSSIRRDRVADAVHRAVCEFTGTDGFGHCQLYASAGWGLLAGLLPGSPRFHIQAGTLRLQADPADPTLWFALLADDGAMARGELHVWLANEDGTLVDLAARHYRRYVDDLEVIDNGEKRVRWTRPDPPAYVWDHLSKLPGWLRLEAGAWASMGINDQVIAHKDRVLMPLTRLALKHYGAL